MPRRFVLTGAAGFVGSALARRLIAELGPEDELLLSDQGDAPSWASAQDVRVSWLPGDISDSGLVASLFDRPVHALAHLAGVVSGAAEKDFDLGARVNLDASRQIFDACARQGRDGQPPRVVYASSIAVHGVPLPARIDDSTRASPSLSYGVQKHINELLLTELSRRGWVDAMSTRLAGVVVRPALPNGALSG